MVNMLLKDEANTVLSGQQFSEVSCVLHVALSSRCSMHWPSA